MSEGECETAEILEGRKICVIYDCLFPLTRGGAERWYRCLVDRLNSSGAAVTYLTRRQWAAEVPVWSGVEVIAVSDSAELYDEVGVRRTGPALTFGAGTLFWLIRHRREYDAVITASFPFFSFLAARCALAGTGTPIFVDYHEVWSREYWRAYTGWARGTMGSLVEELCIGLTRFAQVFTVESAQRLRSRRFQGNLVVLPGLLAGNRIVDAVSSAIPDEPMAIFVGRHVKHKGVRLLPRILAAARISLPNLTMTIVGDGPEREAVEAEFASLGLSGAVTFTGSISDEELGRLLMSASCTVVPSLREGYGIIVAESAAAGTPVVVANNPENLATTLVESGVNGFVVDPSAEGMANGIFAVVTASQPLRQSTGDWSAQHSSAQSMDHSAQQMTDHVRSFMSAKRPKS